MGKNIKNHFQHLANTPRIGANIIQYQYNLSPIANPNPPNKKWAASNMFHLPFLDLLQAAQGTEGQEARGKHLGHRALVPAQSTNGLFLAEDFTQMILPSKNQRILNYLYPSKVGDEKYAAKKKTWLKLLAHGSVCKFPLQQ